MASQLELTQKPFVELQIEALVNENRIKLSKLTKFVNELESRINGLDDDDCRKVIERKFDPPMVLRPNSSGNDYPDRFKFAIPAKIEIIGSSKSSTSLKGLSYVDLAIPMPEKCLEKKDVKNQRYHYKRALYLTQIAHIINKKSIKKGLIRSLEFCFARGDFLKPILLIIPEDEKLRNIATFRIFVYPHPESPIKTSLLHPSHGNLAPKWFFKDYELEHSEESEIGRFIAGDSDTAPSPIYNSSILFDIELISNSDILYEQIKSHTSVKEALMLTKVWLMQRNLHHHFSFTISMFIAYLQTRQIIHQNMSSYQIFKIIIRHIAASDWDGAGLSYFDDSKDLVQAHKLSSTVVFLSPSGNLNLCYDITDDLYQRLKHEARQSQEVLTLNSVDTFELLFLTKIDFLSKFDVIVHLPKRAENSLMTKEHLQEFMNYGAFTPKIYSNSILSSIRKALSDRVVLIQQSSDHLLLNKRWSIKQSAPDLSCEDATLTFGILLEPEKSLRIIDVGPEAQSAEAEEFRKFWEPRSQLRLQNGVISETVLWQVHCFSQRRSLIKYILAHAVSRAGFQTVVVHHTLLERFINLHNVFFHWKDQTDASLREKVGPQKRGFESDPKDPIGVGEEVFQKVLHSYNELNKIVRNVDGLKHSITSIQPVSHHVRGSAVFPPLPVSLQAKNKLLKRRKGAVFFPEDFDRTGKVLFIEPVEILLTLENTGKWPNDLDALEAAKSEYLIQLGEALRDREYCVKFASDYLDVMHGQFVFRLRLKVPKELALASASLGKQEFQKRRLNLEILPRVHAALDQVYREKPAFGLTCRLVKRWLSCHLMTDHISDVAIDLIVAHLFLHPQPYTEPSSSSCGFQRFLMLMSQYDWKLTPLIVNFDNQLKIDEINRIRDAMQEDRSKFPPIVICTPYDKDTSPWAKSEPTLPKLDLLCRLTEKALQFFKTEILMNFDVADECKALFRPNFKLFNLIINLQPMTVQNFFMSIDPPKGYKLVGSEPEGNRASAFKVMPIVGLNIIEQYVRVLRSKYDDIALFFYGKYGQRVIGVVLKPEFAQIYKGDLDSLIDGIKELGSKLVESVVVMRSI